jgi:antitoxin component YwqK of YwqJK toxin-antitoxin module
MKCLFVVFILSSLNAAAQYFEYGEWEQEPQKHGYKQVDVWRYNLQANKKDTSDTKESIVSGSPDFADTILYKTEVFNELGLLILEKGFHGYHYAYEMSTLEYDEKDRVIRQLYYSRDSTLESTRLTVFNDSTKEATACEISNLGLKLERCASIYYTNEGKLQSSEMRYEDNRLAFGKRLVFNSGDSLFIYALYEADSILYLYSVYRHSSNGQLLESILLEKDSTFSQGTYYDYDSKGRILSEKWITDDSKQPRESTYYEYDDDKLKTRTTYYSGSLGAIEKFEKGLLVEELLFDQEIEPEVQYVYKYR